MNDSASYAKARADWDTQQRLADRRFAFDHSKRAFLQVQSRRITHNINELEVLERCDGLIYGPQRFDAAGTGRWPYG